MSAFVSSVTAFPQSQTINPSTCPVATPRETLLRQSTFACRTLSAPVTPLVPHNRRTRSTPMCTVTVERLANKSYQLEEDEDQSSCTTAVYLHADGKVSVGRTDGPTPDRVEATWKYDDASGELILDIERYFQGDGRVEFMVKRILRGHLDDGRKNLENLPVFTGAMYPHPTEFERHSEVGWFAMILATDDLPSDDYDISASN